MPTSDSYKTWMTNIESAPSRDPAFWTKDSWVTNLEEPERSAFVADLKHHFLEHQSNLNIGFQWQVTQVLELIDTQAFAELVEIDYQRLLKSEEPLDMYSAKFGIDLIRKRLTLQNDAADIESDVSFALDIAQATFDSYLPATSSAGISRTADSLNRLLRFGSAVHVPATIRLVANVQSNNDLVQTVTRLLIHKLGVSSPLIDELVETFPNPPEHLIERAVAEARPAP